MNKVKLNFMVVPDQLEKIGYVENPVRVKIVDINKIEELGILGQSGLKLAEAGAEFIFSEDYANRLIGMEIAVKI